MNLKAHLYTIAVIMAIAAFTSIPFLFPSVLVIKLSAMFAILLPAIGVCVVIYLAIYNIVKEYMVSYRKNYDK